MIKFAKKYLFNYFDVNQILELHSEKDPQEKNQCFRKEWKNGQEAFLFSVKELIF